MGGATIAADCQSEMAVFVGFYPKTIGPFWLLLYIANEKKAAALGF